MMKNGTKFSSTIKTLSICLIFSITLAVGVIAVKIPEKEIVIADNYNEKNQVSEEIPNIELAKVEDGTATLKETIEVKTEEIPFETVSQDGATENGSNTYVVKNGVKGQKEITYKVKYENDTEVSREEISSRVTKKAVDKVIGQRQETIVVASRSEENTASVPESTDQQSSSEPIVKTMNVSAYCSCSSCCGKSNGITASGARASSWYTVAAGKSYPIGTRIYIPYFKDMPNGGWFVVQDRGGAIGNNRLDIYMGSHSEALKFGRRNLECYIYKN